jgi:hypothetical protein
MDADDVINVLDGLVSIAKLPSNNFKGSCILAKMRKLPWMINAGYFPIWKVSFHDPEHSGPANISYDHNLDDR